MTELPFTISIDKTGFPIIETSDLPFALLWLPITKIQFEHFLVDTGLYDNDWYQDKLQNYNARISSGSANASNYWQMFMTGILPEEAQHYADWCGRGFDLPTAQEWKDAFNYFAQLPANPAFITSALDVLSLNERAKLLITRLDAILQEESKQLVGGRRLCDQMVMRLGVTEFVYETSQCSSFCGWGQPNKRLYSSSFNPLHDTVPMRFINRTTGSRMKHGGFRLLRRR